MIIPVVQISWEGPKRELDAVLDQALEAAKICHYVKGLKRNHCINSDASGGGKVRINGEAGALPWLTDAAK